MRLKEISINKWLALVSTPALLQWDIVWMFGIGSRNGATLLTILTGACLLWVLVLPGLSWRWLLPFLIWTLAHVGLHTYGFFQATGKNRDFTLILVCYWLIITALACLSWGLGASVRKFHTYLDEKAFPRRKTLRVE